VSESPTIAPVGAATAVIFEVPDAFTIPVNVATPVPPPATGRVPYSTVVPPLLTLSGLLAAPTANLTNLVALFTRISPAA